MSVEKAVEAVRQIPGATVRTSEMMSRHTPLRIGGAMTYGYMSTTCPH